MSCHMVKIFASFNMTKSTLYKINKNQNGNGFRSNEHDFFKKTGIVMSWKLHISFKVSQSWIIHRNHVRHSIRPCHKSLMPHTHPNCETWIIPDNVWIMYKNAYCLLDNSTKQLWANECYGVLKMCNRCMWMWNCNPFFFVRLLCREFPSIRHYPTLQKCSASFTVNTCLRIKSTA